MLTEVENQPVPPGILQPALQYRFVVSPIIGMDNCPEITRNLVCIKYDLATKTGSMVVQIPMVGNGVVFKLNAMMNGCDSIIIENTDGCNNIASSVGLRGIKFTKCEIAHDYALGGVVEANIEFTFRSIITTTGIDGTEKIIESV